MRLLSYAELALYLLLATFVLPVALGDELNLIKPLNLSMAAFHYLYLLNSKFSF